MLTVFYRLGIEGSLRLLYYLFFAFWAVLITINPPVVFAVTSPMSIHILWALVTIIGSIIACVGVITRKDLKVELPGLLLMLFAPLYYTGCFFLFFQFPAGTELVHIGDFAYSLFPLLSLLPRAASLVKTTRQYKKIGESQ